MQKFSYRIRVMTRQEMDIAFDWAAAEGWNPGWYDADCFRAADPDGFLVGLLEDKMGPLFADSPQLADQLFLSLKAHTPDGAPMFLNTPEVNSAAVDLAKRHNMMVAFETARMYTGKGPDLPLSRLFGVTTFELG